MLHKTRGIVLRTVKYGDTSVIATLYTELFGVQSYIVNGVRTTPKKGVAKANLFQPAAILDLVVYHSELKNLQRLKEYKWGVLYQDLFFSVIKNSVALFMVELLQKTLKQPEPNPDLYQFTEDAFLHLDTADETTIANYPLFFALHLTSFYGFHFSDKYSESLPVLDLKEGEFVKEKPAHPYYLDGQFSFISSQILKAMLPHELSQLKLNQETRRILLNAYQTYYALHIPEFGVLRSLAILQEVLS
jgi:DNA repair protein RecO (recombination protein O)